MKAHARLRRVSERFLLALSPSADRREEPLSDGRGSDTDGNSGSTGIMKTMMIRRLPKPGSSSRGDTPSATEFGTSIVVIGPNHADRGIASRLLGRPDTCILYAQELS
jgi:hypothetical protein